MGASLWLKETWEKIFANNMVIVCTAEVLQQCMMHSFITIAQINLLIFDEAHHAKSNHPYARIMRDYYAYELDKSKRPRIFGMTASPVDVKSSKDNDIKTAARDLEKLLCSKIATTADGTFASSSTSRPEEQIALYDRLQTEFETPFHQKVKARYGDIQPFKKFFIASKRIGSELGRWASDMYWSFAFADEQARKLESREEYRYNKENKGGGSVQKLDTDLARLREAAAFVQEYNFGLPTLTDRDLSSKVRQLHYYLNLYYERSDEARSIVFVEQRQTARLLKLIFEHIGGPNLHCDMLVGINSQFGENHISLRSQILTVAKFRRGELNCLFATSVAEEGLDIPQCNLVVRFDLYRTMIGYVQSRGRARHRNSKYLHMLERGNHSHNERLFQARSDEHVMRNFCRTLPQDRLLDVPDADSDDIQDDFYPSYTDSITGAKLTYRSSLTVLNHFVATLPAPSHETYLQPTYVVSSGVTADSLNSQRTGFQCEVILPEYSPVISITGEVQSRKLIARCSAAFNMCVELRSRGLLDENLLPTVRKFLPAMRSAQLAVGEKKKGMYPMLIKPSFWKQGRGVIPEHLYLTVVNVDAGLDRPHQPLGLLTRVRFPQLPSFPIYLTDGRPSNVISYPLVLPHSLTEDALKSFTTFTLRVYEDVFNKVYDYDIQKMSYWIVPVRQNMLSMPGLSTKLEQIVDLEQVRQVCNKPIWQWTPKTKDEDLLDKYIVDPMNGGRRFYSNCLAPHLKPQDPVPSHIPRQNQKFMDSILDYSDSRWLRSRDISTWNQSQPVLEVEKIPFRRNHLALVENKEREVFDSLKTYICPQPMRISNVSSIVLFKGLYTNTK